MLEWRGGILEGNCNLQVTDTHNHIITSLTIPCVQARGGITISGGLKRLRHQMQVINLSDGKWTSGNIVSDPQSRFINKHALETSHGPSGKHVQPSEHHSDLNICRSPAPY